MLLIGSCLFKNGCEIIFHHIKVINSSLIAALFLKAEPDISRSVQKILQIFFLQHVKIKKRQIPPPQLFMSIRDKIMFSGSKNNGVILLFLPHLPVMFTVRNSKGILSCT